MDRETRMLASFGDHLVVLPSTAGQSLKLGVLVDRDFPIPRIAVTNPHFGH